MENTKFRYSPEGHSFVFKKKKISSQKSVGIFNALARSVSGTLQETFETAAQFAELHRDIVAEFGRFPHRNEVLGRANTSAETEYLAGDSPSFGQ